MQVATAPGVGQKAPSFRLKGPGGQWIALDDYRGRRNVVLVFYPLAFSPVCSHQLPQIEREMPRLRALEAEVLGISVDSHYANEAFAKRLGLSFPLLSDFRRETSVAYGLLDAERHYSGRALVVVDRQGTIAYRDRTPSPANIPDLEPLLAALERLR